MTENINPEGHIIIPEDEAGESNLSQEDPDDSVA